MAPSKSRTRRVCNRYRTTPMCTLR